VLITSYTTGKELRCSHVSLSLWPSHFFSSLLLFIITHVWFSRPTCKTSTGNELVFVSLLQQPFLLGRSISVYWKGITDCHFSIWLGHTSATHIFICRKILKFTKSAHGKSILDLMDAYLILKTCLKEEDTYVQKLFSQEDVTCILHWILFCVFFLNTHRCLNKSLLF